MECNDKIEFTIPKNNLPILEDRLKHIKENYHVLVNKGIESEMLLWIALEGQKNDAHMAKAYVCALCDPQVKCEFTFDKSISIFLLDPSVFVGYEKCFRVAIIPGKKEGTLEIQGQSQTNILLALSKFEDLELQYLGPLESMSPSKSCITQLSRSGSQRLDSELRRISSEDKGMLFDTSQLDSMTPAVKRSLLSGLTDLHRKEEGKNVTQEETGMSRNVFNQARPLDLSNIEVDDYLKSTAGSLGYSLEAIQQAYNDLYRHANNIPPSPSLVIKKLQESKSQMALAERLKQAGMLEHKNEYIKKNTGGRPATHSSVNSDKSLCDATLLMKEVSVSKTIKSEISDEMSKSPQFPIELSSDVKLPKAGEANASQAPLMVYLEQLQKHFKDEDDEGDDVEKMKERNKMRQNILKEAQKKNGRNNEAILVQNMPATKEKRKRNRRRKKKKGDGNSVDISRSPSISPTNENNRAFSSNVRLSRKVEYEYKNASDSTGRSRSALPTPSPRRGEERRGEDSPVDNFSSNSPSPQRRRRNQSSSPHQSNLRRSDRPTDGQWRFVSSSSRPLVNVNPNQLRHIIIDGSNVAMAHSRGKYFSCQGLKICVEYFEKRGHRDITIFVPQWRSQCPSHYNQIQDQHIMMEMREKGVVVFTPARKIPGRANIVCYDDIYVMNLARETDSVVVSNDNYRDLFLKYPEFAEIIEYRILPFAFVGDLFMPPEDPLGQNGPSLSDFLLKTSVRRRKETNASKRSPSPVNQNRGTRQVPKPPWNQTPMPGAAGQQQQIRQKFQSPKVLGENRAAYRLLQAGNAQNIGSSDPSPRKAESGGGELLFPHQIEIYTRLMAVFPDHDSLIRKILANHRNERDIERLCQHVSAVVFN